MAFKLNYSPYSKKSRSLIRQKCWCYYTMIVQVLTIFNQGFSLNGRPYKCKLVVYGNSLKPSQSVI